MGGVGEDRTGEPRANQERLTVAQTATRLGITEGAVRSRIKRGTLPTTKEGGTVFVLLGGGTPQANQTTNTGVPGDQSGLIEALRDQIEDLRRERDEWREQARITDRLLSAAMERIPALEPPEVPKRASEPVATTETPQEPAEQKTHKEESSPPQGQDSSDSTLREGAQRGVLVEPRPRWAQIGVAVLLAGMITTIPQLIWLLATEEFPSTQFVFGILHPLTLLCGLWAGLAWPGRHPKELAVLGSLAGLLDLVINWSIAVILRPADWYITPYDFLSTIGIAALFTAGGLFGDLIESWRLPRRREQESEVVRVIAQQASGPGRQPSETTLKLIQALGPSILALLGVIITAIQVVLVATS